MLIRQVERFLREHDMAATKFGRLAARDPRFVLDLRMGRIPRPRTEDRIVRWMNDFERTSPSPRSSRLAPSLSSNTVETKGFHHAY